jgi:hypothetical protein
MGWEDDHDWQIDEDLKEAVIACLKVQSWHSLERLRKIRKISG